MSDNTGNNPYRFAGIQESDYQRGYNDGAQHERARLQAEIDRLRALLADKNCAEGE